MNFPDMEPNPATLPGIAQVIDEAYRGIVAIGYTEVVEDLRPVPGWWRRLWRFFRGRPTWELTEVRGYVEFTIVHVDEYDEDNGAAVHAAVEYARPAGVVVRLRFAQKVPISRYSTH